VTDSSSTEIISKLVIQEAGTLLRQTHWTVAEIAYTLGFDARSAITLRSKLPLRPWHFGLNS
jgi:AraC-like DNA-binding protein